LRKLHIVVSLGRLSRPMAPVLVPAATVGLIMLPLILFHQPQLKVCAVIATRLSGVAANFG